MEKPNPLDDETLAEQLGRLVQALTAAGRAAFPGSADALLSSIVQAAARIFGASAASIMLVNEDEDMLEFKVAHGAADHDLVGTRIPIDQGIAGYVVMTGQPIAISNVEEDTRFNRDFAKSTGYVPRSILATPLIVSDRILGVMEVLDKIDAPSFGMQDMELLGMFAHQAALAIDQAQNSVRLGEAWVKNLVNLAQSDADHPKRGLATALETLPDSGSQEDLFVLADLFNEFSWLGDAERKTCLKVLSAFTEYGRSQKRPLRRMSLS
jgi:GAF domain-containing protein